MLGIRVGSTVVSSVAILNLRSQLLPGILNETRMDNTPTTPKWDQINALREFRSRKKTSDIEIVAISIERACVTWQGYNTAGVFLMDINAAFPRGGCSTFQRQCDQQQSCERNQWHPKCQDCQISIGGKHSWDTICGETNFSRRDVNHTARQLKQCAADTIGLPSQ